jgi:anti-anti-sigma factor
MGMVIERIEGDSECTFIILCELISQNINAVTEELNRFAKNDTRDAILDLASVRKIDSMSIAALIRFKNALSEKNRSLSLVNPNETVLRVLELSGLERFLMD